MTIPWHRPGRSAPLACVLALLAATSAPLFGCPTPPPRAPGAPPPPSPTRLAGDWEVNTTLSLQEAKDTLQVHLLGIIRRFAQLLDGQVELPGLPPFLARLATPFLRDLARQHVPAWARELISRLGRIHDTFSEMRFEAIHTLRPKGAFSYQGHTRLTRISLQTSQGVVSTVADRLPGLGSLTLAPYAAQERDGMLLIAAHPLRQSHAHLLRWALDALVSAVTCHTPGAPCLRSLRAAADHLLDCAPLSRKLLALAPALGAAGPLVQAACEAQKKQLLDDADAALGKVALTLTTLELSGEARISPDGQHLTGGRWFGRLGKAYGEGGFRGEFTARSVLSQTGPTSPSPCRSR